MKGYILTFFVLLFGSGNCFAQNRVIDSVRNELQKTKYDSARVNILNALGWHFVNIGRYDSAMKYVAEAKKLAEEIQYKRGIAKSLNITGVFFDNEGNYSKALKNHFAALKISEEIKDSGGIAASYGNMAVIYAKQRNYDDALKYYFASLKLLSDKKAVATVYNNIGIVYQDQGKYDEALKAYFTSLKMREELGNKRGLADCYINIGLIYGKQGDHAKALSNLLAALKISEEIGDYQGVAISNVNIASIYLATGKYKEAISLLDSALKAACAINDKETVKDAYGTLSEIYEKLNDYKAALAYHKLYFAISDSLLNKERSKQITEMRTKYETEKKDKEIIVLNKDKEIQTVKIDKQKAAVKYVIAGFLLLIVFGLIAIRLYNQKRKASFMQQVAETKMKALRAQMNPHFIFNSLNSVYRYMQVNDFKSASEYLISFSKLIRLILENSLHKEIPLAEELKALELFLSLESMRLDKKFVYEINVAAEIDKDNTLIPPLLLEPFVENSIWHGFKDKNSLGRITLSISKDGEMMKCIIEDNGVGRKPLSELKASANGEKKESVGMKLTEERIATINQVVNSKASVIITDLFDELKNPAGVKVELSLPLQLID